MTEEAELQEVRDYIVALPRYQGGTLSDDFPLLESEVLDSLGVFELVAIIESSYGVHIGDEELVAANFATLADIARLVRQKRAEGG